MNGYQQVLQPPAAPAAPPAALAAGMTQLVWQGTTLGTSGTADVTKQWFPFNFLTNTPIANQAIQQGDGSIYMSGPNGAGFNATIATAQKIGSATKGMGFKGSFYVEWDIYFNTVVETFSQADFPSVWRDDQLYLAQVGGGAQQWSGMPSSFNRHIEIDDLEYVQDLITQASFVGCADWAQCTGANITSVVQGSTTTINSNYAAAANPFLVGSTVSFAAPPTDWTNKTGVVTSNSGSSGAYSCVISLNSTAFTGSMVGISAHVSLSGSTLTSGNNRSNTTAHQKRVLIGAMLQAAVSGGANGFVRGYANNVLMTRASGLPATYSWTFYNSGSPTLPPNTVAAATMMNYTDTTTHILIAGTRQDGTVPMSVYGVRVWAADSSVLVPF